VSKFLASVCIFIFLEINLSKSTNMRKLKMPRKVNNFPFSPRTHKSDHDTNPITKEVDS
jgi:hypothetical protein